MKPLSVPPEHWEEFSRLLDEAFLLQPEGRTAWLAKLPRTADHLRDRLREVLAAGADAEQKSYLSVPRIRSSPDHDEEFASGDVLCAYRLVDRLGQGGMGEVWSARRVDGTLDRVVALKLPRAGLFGIGVRQRLMRERDILAALTHPNIAQIHDAGVTSQGQPYLALELVEGRAIDAHCRLACLHVHARIDLFRQVIDAVRYAHGRLIVHRDLKPSNVMVTNDGRVKLLDFGIAKLIDDGNGGSSELTRLVGAAMTPEYAAPEQLAGEPVSVATDVFSLGIVLFELLTGQRPFPRQRDGSEAPLASTRAGDAHATECGLRDARGLRTALRGDLDAILAKCLSPRPEDRYASVEQLADDLSRHERHQPIRARRIGRVEQVRKFVRRNRLAVGLGTALALAVTLGFAGVLWQAHRAQGAADEAGLARTQAEASRRRAQGLVTFMLGDLRKQMTSVGRLDALDSTVSEVNRYLTDSGRDLDATERASQSEAYVAMSEIAVGRGRMADGVEAGRKAVASARDLPEDFPGRPIRLGAALQALSEPLMSADGCAEAGPLLEEARALLVPQQARSPDDPGLALVLAKTYDSSGFQFSTSGCGTGEHEAEAVEFARRCVSLLEKARGVLPPGSAGSYAKMQLQCGQAFAMGEFYSSGTTGAFEELVRQMTPLVDEYARDFDVLSLVTSAMAQAGIQLARAGRPDVARQATGLALRLGRVLHERDPDNAEYRLQYASALSAEVEQHLAARVWAQALDASTEGLDVIRGGMAIDADAGRWRLEAIVMHHLRAYARFRLRQPYAVVLREIQDALDVPSETADPAVVRLARLRILAEAWLFSDARSRPAAQSAFDALFREMGTAATEEPDLSLCRAMIDGDAGRAGSLIGGQKSLLSPYLLAFVRDAWCPTLAPGRRRLCRGEAAG